MVYENNYFELVKYLISLDKMDAYVKDITILKIKWHLKKIIIKFQTNYNL